MRAFSNRGADSKARMSDAALAHRVGGALLSRWEHFDHDADIGIRGIGTTREEAFEQAAVALTAIVTDPDRVAARHRIDVSCGAIDDESLLVGWLNALIYEMATRRMLFSRFHVAINQGRLEASAWGEPISSGRHAPVVEVKGASFTALEVAQVKDGLWLAQTVVDV